MWVNPAQPPSVSRCAPRSRSPVCCVPDHRSCSCRWGPCPSPTPRLACPFYFFIWPLPIAPCFCHATERENVGPRVARFGPLQPHTAAKPRGASPPMTKSKKKGKANFFRFPVPQGASKKRSGRGGRVRRERQPGIAPARSSLPARGCPLRWRRLPSRRTYFVFCVLRRNFQTCKPPRASLSFLRAAPFLHSPRAKAVFSLSLSWMNGVLVCTLCAVVKRN